MEGGGGGRKNEQEGVTVHDNLRRLSATCTPPSYLDKMYTIKDVIRVAGADDWFISRNPFPPRSKPTETWINGGKLRPKIDEPRMCSKRSNV